MKQFYKKESDKQIEKNIMFVSTIYDSFEALEETLSKLKLQKSTDLIRMAKNLFAKEVFKYAQENNIYINDKPENKETRISIN